MEHLKIEDILNRLKELLSINTDLQLSEIIGTRPGTLSSWKSRGSVDYELILSLCREKRFNLNYIFFGEGEPYFIPESKHPDAYEIKRNLENVVRSISKVLHNLPSDELTIAELVKRDMIAKDLELKKFIENLNQERCAEHDKGPDLEISNGKVTYSKDFCCEAFKKIITDKVTNQLSNDIGKNRAQGIADMFDELNQI